MIKLQTVGISVDKGNIPITYKFSFKANTPNICIDKEIIPPKNYFKTKLSGVNVSIENSKYEDMLIYSIIN